jgi:hypothetical protein
MLEGNRANELSTRCERAVPTIRLDHHSDRHSPTPHVKQQRSSKSEHQLRGVAPAFIPGDLGIARCHERFGPSSSVEEQRPHGLDPLRFCRSSSGNRHASSPQNASFASGWPIAAATGTSLVRQKCHKRPYRMGAFDRRSRPCTAAVLPSGNVRAAVHARRCVLFVSVSSNRRAVVHARRCVLFVSVSSRQIKRITNNTQPRFTEPNRPILLHAHVMFRITDIKSAKCPE